MSDIDIGQPDLAGLCVTRDAESTEAGSGLVNGYSLAAGQAGPVACDLPTAGVDRTIRMSTAAAVLAVAAIAAYVSYWHAGGTGVRAAAGQHPQIASVAGIGMVAEPATAWWAIVLVLFVYGLATAQLSGVVLADVPVANRGQASGTQSTSRQIGSAFGIAILGMVLLSALGALLSQRLSGIPGCRPGSAPRW